MMAGEGQFDVLAETSVLMDRWNRECFQGSATPTDILVKLCEIVEQQTEVYFKTDPDPFDDRHPGRADPNCTLGHVLKIILKNDDFIQALAHTYLSRDQHLLHAVTCRIILNIMPGLEAIAVFKEHESSISKFFQWAETAQEPLRSYSIGILAFIMEGQEHASAFKESNHKLVPILMRRLHSIIDIRVKKPTSSKLTRPFSQFSAADSTAETSQPHNTKTDIKSSPADKENKASERKQVKSLNRDNMKSDDVTAAVNRPTDIIMAETVNNCSNSSWQEMEPLIIQSYQIYPVTSEVQQRLILSYLTPMGEYQELLPEVFQNKAMDIVFHYLDYQNNIDVRLGFIAVRYLASLLCHKKFGIEFINNGGLEKFLSVPRPSLAATGVSLCLYYLAFFEDTMERVCMQSTELLTEVIAVVLWLLECSHQSGRMHSVMFLSNALTFKAFLDIFDQMDGLRKLYNVLSTSEIINSETSDYEFSDDQMYVFRQAIRHVTYAIKKYFESHACIMADKLRQSLTQSRDRNSPTAPEITPFKTMKLSPEMFAEDINLLSECLSTRSWKPATVFHKLNGVQLFLKTITLIAEWPAYTGKAESVRWLLDTLAVCAVHPLIQSALCTAVELPDGVASPAVSILLGMADTDILCEPEVQKSALNVIINLVCAPSDMPASQCAAQRRLNKSVSSGSAAAAAPSGSVGGGNLSFLQKLWGEFRQNNGIMVLLKLVQIQSPLTGADAIRALACQALVGLSRSDTMCQIMSKLPLFNNGQLQVLMKEPVLQDKRNEHIKFCKYASLLIEQVCGRPQNINTDISLDHIRKADVVAHTKIVYKEKELLQLMYDHLIQNGLEKAAEVLQKEADLPVRTTNSVTQAHSAQLYDSPALSQCVRPSTHTGRQLHMGTPSTPVPSTSGGSRATPSTPGGLRFNIKNATNSTTSQLLESPRQRPTSSSKQSRSRHDLRTFNSVTSSNKKMTLSLGPAVADPAESMTLDKIITSYFRKQHALCKNPVVTCPPFSLYEPHVCPEPARKNIASGNLTMRVMRNMTHLDRGGYEGAAMDRKYKFSRFKPIKTYKDSEGGNAYSCVTFSACEQWLMLGSYSGDLKLYNIQTGEEAETYNCHSSPLSHAQPSRDGMLLLTSSSWGRPLSALWTMDNFFDQKIAFAEEQYVEFSKSVQDRIVGTCDTTAKVYDVATGTKILTLYDESRANNYLRNQATFNCYDDLVLNDGVLWDVLSGKVIHKFDKFNPQVSGLFHPLGLEVIINSEIWDLRTFKLLHTVPALNQCQIRFSHDASVLYGAVIPHDDEEDENGPMRNLYSSSFRTFDARSYSCLSTIDVKRSINDLCTDKSDMFLAVIESLKDNDTLQEDCQCRLYEVGAVKTTEELAQEEEEDHDEGDSDDEEDEVEDDMGASDGEILDIIDDIDAEEEQTDGDNIEAELADLLADQEDDVEVDDAADPVNPLQSAAEEEEESEEEPAEEEEEPNEEEEEHAEEEDEHAEEVTSSELLTAAMLSESVQPVLDMSVSMDNNSTVISDDEDYMMPDEDENEMAEEDGISVDRPGIVSVSPQGDGDASYEEEENTECDLNHNATETEEQSDSGGEDDSSSDDDSDDSSDHSGDFFMNASDLSDIEDDDEGDL